MNKNKALTGLFTLAATYMILNSGNSKGILGELWKGAQRNVEALYGRSNING